MNMVDGSTLLTTIFVLIDDSYQQKGYRYVPLLPGPSPKSPFRVPLEGSQDEGEWQRARQDTQPRGIKAIVHRRSTDPT
jgi:hypothetical protein